MSRFDHSPDSSQSLVGQNRRLIAAISPGSLVASYYTMAAGLERLERNIEKLESFFSKRKKTMTPRGSVSDVAGSQPSNLMMTGELSAAPMFPSPSFIRPKSTRMQAREEPTRLARRANSLPEPTGTQRQANSAGSSVKMLTHLQIPRRASSLFHRRPNASMVGSIDSSLAIDSSQCSESSLYPPSPAFAIPRQVETALFRRMEGYTMAVRSRYPDTPPLSDQEDCTPSTSPNRMKPLPAVPGRTTLTPQPSPVLLPVPDRAGKNTISSTQEELRVGPRRPVSLDNTKSGEKRILRKVMSAPTLAAPATIGDPVLKEPTVDEFLSLSDDDIADDTLSIRSQSDLDDSPASQSPSKIPKSHDTCTDLSLLTLTSSFAGKPAALAAFEAARIAARHKFDLVYVVNLWSTGAASEHDTSSQPACTARLAPVGDFSSDAQGPLACINQRPGVTGRLLAAYGLPSVMSPFRISAPVHEKVLQTDGWLEYRSENPAPDEFARGYSCSFPTEKGAARGRRLTRGSERTRLGRKRAMRGGIVFAAYRLPRLNGTSLASDLVELDMLFRDAENLVEMLIDIHAMEST
ncbi:hypothetical protein VTK73DRAFT_257 [Phialemonium thermophilum]|uniref:Uncharacterized protein n=1 Tax=Phialemonium thermophilum TaxID=223376 RepID=A0ABR3XGI1_9PEZI